MKNKIKVGTERMGANGETLRLCKTESGQLQWRKIGENGEPIKRGRKEGTKFLKELSLQDLLQQVGGRKFASAVKSLAKETGNEEAFSAKILVSSKWGESAQTEKEAKPAKESKPKAKSKVLATSEVI
jgi:hypothetical protein